MKRGVTLIAVIFLFALLAGCATVPKEAALLNEKVSEGISHNQAAVEVIIKKIASEERNKLDDYWDTLYADTEKSYLASEQIPNASSMTQKDRRIVAATACDAFDSYMAKLDAKEQELLMQSRFNTRYVLDMNNTVTEYLLSLEELDKAQAKIINLYEKIGLKGLDELYSIVPDSFK